MELNDRHLTQSKPQRIIHRTSLRQPRLFLKRLNRIQRPLLILAIGWTRKEAQANQPLLQKLHRITPQTSTQANPQEHD
jgi:hypothetical protein